MADDPPLVLVVDDEQSYRDALSVDARSAKASSSSPRPTVRRRSNASTPPGPRSCCST